MNDVITRHNDAPDEEYLHYSPAEPNFSSIGIRESKSATLSGIDSDGLQKGSNLKSSRKQGLDHASSGPTGYNTQLYN